MSGSAWDPNDPVGRLLVNVLAMVASEVRLPNELRARTVQREWLLVAAGGTGEQ
jgi:hypothetical protein